MTRMAHRAPPASHLLLAELVEAGFTERQREVLDRVVTIEAAKAHEEGRQKGYAEARNADLVWASVVRMAGDLIFILGFFGFLLGLLLIVTNGLQRTPETPAAHPGPELSWQP